MFGRCLGDVWPMFGRCLADVWPMFGRCLADVWPMFGRCLADVWPMFGRCLAGLFANLGWRALSKNYFPCVVSIMQLKTLSKSVQKSHGPWPRISNGPKKKGRKARTMSPACLEAVAMAASGYLLSLRYPLRYSSLNANWLLAWGRPKFFVCFITLL